MGHISEAWTNLAPPGANCVTDCAMEAHRARGMFTFCMSHLIPAYKRAAVTQAEASEGYVGAIALPLQTGFMPSTPRLGVLAMGALCRMGSCSDRFIASRGGARRRFGSLGACERLPQTLDCLGETCNLVREPLCVCLLRGEKAPHSLQLILNDLQLVDRFLLGSFQTLGFLYELFGGLCGPNLQLAGSNDAVLFGGSAGIRAP